MKQWYEPMEPVLIRRIREGENYVHQIKWDGIRGIAVMEDRRVRIFNKSGRERTGFYPETESLADSVKAEKGVFDGELVVFDGLKPSFRKVLKRDQLKSTRCLDRYIKEYPVKYILFDILSLNGEDLRGKPWAERNEILRSSFTRNENIVITDDFRDGKALFAFTKQKGLEGIVTKDINSIYAKGKNHESWFKVKNEKSLLAVVCGVTLKQGYPNALILGGYDQGKLVYIGNVATGLKESDKDFLFRNKEKLRQEESPFQEMASSPSSVWWFRPLLTCRVRFLEWTTDGVMRHPVLSGFSASPAKEAVIEGEDLL
jgi:bifunctional non-homologous end joining protein LigD